MNFRSLADIDFNNKKVLIRVDFNVPLDNGVITDENRIVQALPTIKYLIDNNAKLILFSHLGKVKTEEDKLKLTLKPVANRLSELLNKEVNFINQTRGPILEDAINNLQPTDVLMFENTRFEDLDGKKESSNDQKLGKYWASLGDSIFINDAFGTAHRAHASNVGIASNCDIVAPGYLLEKEIKFIGNTIQNPKKPLVAILGGAKVSDKIGVISNLLNIADYVLVGGGMTYTFLKAQGYNIGTSLVEDDKLELAKELLEKSNGKLILPVDTTINNDFAPDGDIKVVDSKELPDNYMGLDIGPKTIELFSNYIKDASTVIWNGPMGVFEMENFAKGTIGVCESIAQNKEAITIIGGGDSAAAAIQLGYAQDFTHISTGGGASLEYFEGKKLPGIECLLQGDK